MPFMMAYICQYAGVAQLAEQLICNQQVAGSSPIASSSFLSGNGMQRSIIGGHMDGFPSGQREQTVNLPSQTSVVRIHPHPPFFPSHAAMAELADALDSGSSEGFLMEVQVLLAAPNSLKHKALRSFLLSKALRQTALLSTRFFGRLLEGNLVARIQMKQVEGIGRVALDKAIEEFLRHCRLRNLSPRTLEYYEEDLRYFKSHMSIQYADEISKEKLEELIEHEMNKGNRVTAINARVRGLRVFFRFCAEREYAEGFKFPLLKEDETMKEPYPSLSTALPS